jgi:hypothetical protein
MDRCGGIGDPDGGGGELPEMLNCGILKQKRLLRIATRQEENRRLLARRKYSFLGGKFFGGEKLGVMRKPRGGGVIFVFYKLLFHFYLQVFLNFRCSLVEKQKCHDRGDVV